MGMDPERKDRVMDRDHAQTFQRDALQYTKDYGLFVLRTCILLNGGAIIALLTAVTHQSELNCYRPRCRPFFDSALSLRARLCRRRCRVWLPIF